MGRTGAVFWVLCCVAGVVEGGGGTRDDDNKTCLGMENFKMGRKHRGATSCEGKHFKLMMISQEN